MKSLLGNTRRPEISFFTSGRIDISASIAKHLCLKSGDVIDILYDEKSGECYLYVKVRQPNGHHTGSVYRTNLHGNNYRTFTKKLTTAILQLCNTNNTARLAVGTPIINEQYGTMLPLITRLLL
jgi:hypothetical protein